MYTARLPIVRASVASHQISVVRVGGVGDGGVGVQQMLLVAADKTGQGWHWEIHVQWGLGVHWGGGDSCTVRSAGPWGKGAGTRWGPCMVCSNASWVMATYFPTHYKHNDRLTDTSEHITYFVFRV